MNFLIIEGIKSIKKAMKKRLLISQKKLIQNVNLNSYSK